MKVKAKCPSCEGENIKSPTESCGVCVGGMVEVELIDSLTMLIQQALLTMSNDERHDFMYEATEGYCRYCGGTAPCYCMNDE